MPYPMKKMRVADLFQNLSEMSIERLTKPDLGKFGTPILKEIVEQLKRELLIIHKVFDDVSDEMLDQAISSYSSYIALLRDIASARGEDYVSRREEFSQQLMDRWNATRSS